AKASCFTVPVGKPCERNAWGFAQNATKTSPTRSPTAQNSPPRFCAVGRLPRKSWLRAQWERAQKNTVHRCGSCFRLSKSICIPVLDGGQMNISDCAADCKKKMGTCSRSFDTASHSFPTVD